MMPSEPNPQEKAYLENEIRLKWQTPPLSDKSVGIALGYLKKASGKKAGRSRWV
jgi:hypothetical protein